MRKVGTPRGGGGTAAGGRKVPVGAAGAISIKVGTGGRCGGGGGSGVGSCPMGGGGRAERMAARPGKGGGTLEGGGAFEGSGALEGIGTLEGVGALESCGCPFGRGGADGGLLLVTALDLLRSLAAASGVSRALYL